MHVRQGDAHDWPFIYTLAREAIPYSISPWRKQPLDETLKYREQLLKGFWGWIKQTDSQALIAETESGTKIGYLILYPTSREELTGMIQAWVMDLAVSPKWRGRGAGKALLEAAEKYCREKNISYLGLAVSSHNFRALSLYENLGFAEERKLMVKVIKDEQ